MLIIFQRKIIYMGYFPINSRTTVRLWLPSLISLASLSCFNHPSLLTCHAILHLCRPSRVKQKFNLLDPIVKNLDVQEISVPSLDKGVTLRGLELRRKGCPPDDETDPDRVVIYFQG